MLPRNTARRSRPCASTQLGFGLHAFRRSAGEAQPPRVMGGSRRGPASIWAILRIAIRATSPWLRAAGAGLGCTWSPWSEHSVEIEPTDLPERRIRAVLFVTTGVSVLRGHWTRALLKLAGFRQHVWFSGRGASGFPLDASSTYPGFFAPQLRANPTGIQRPKSTCRSSSAPISPCPVRKDRLVVLDVSAIMRLAGSGGRSPRHRQYRSLRLLDANQRDKFEKLAGDLAPQLENKVAGFPPQQRIVVGSAFRSRPRKVHCRWNNSAAVSGSRTVTPTATLAEHIGMGWHGPDLQVTHACTGTLAQLLNCRDRRNRCRGPAPLIAEALERLRPAHASPRSASSAAFTRQWPGSIEEVPPERLDRQVQGGPGNIFEPWRKVWRRVVWLRNACLRAAAALGRNGDAVPPEQIVFDGFFTLSEPELELVEALAGGHPSRLRSRRGATRSPAAGVRRVLVRHFTELQRAPGAGGVLRRHPRARSRGDRPAHSHARRGRAAVPRHRHRLARL